MGGFVGWVGTARSPHIRFVDITQNIQPSHDVIAPAGIIAGDLLFYVDASNEAGVPVHIPTGFTTRSSLSLGNHRIILSDKLADGTESGTTLTGLFSTAKTTAALLHFSCTTANFDFPVAVTLGTQGVQSGIADSNPGPSTDTQTTLNGEYQDFDAILILFIWHSSPSLSWSDVGGGITDFTTPQITASVNPFQTFSDTHVTWDGASYDLSNADANIGLRLTWASRWNGQTSALSFTQNFLTDPGSANATIMASYQPAPAGA